jgi:hypothetical protein
VQGVAQRVDPETALVGWSAPEAAAPEDPDVEIFTRERSHADIPSASSGDSHAELGGRFRQAIQPTTIDSVRSYGVFVERLLLFLLGCLLCLLSLLRFLGHLALLVPKLAQCKSTIDMHTFRIHHNCKIDTARFEEGKRPRDLRPDEALA